jgi:hypothetical protein
MVTFSVAFVGSQGYVRTNVPILSHRHLYYLFSKLSDHILISWRDRSEPAVHSPPSLPIDGFKYRQADRRNKTRISSTRSFLDDPLGKPHS